VDEQGRSGSPEAMKLAEDVERKQAEEDDVRHTQQARVQNRIFLLVAVIMRYRGCTGDDAVSCDSHQHGARPERNAWMTCAHHGDGADPLIRPCRSWLSMRTTSRQTVSCSRRNLTSSFYGRRQLASCRLTRVTS